MEDTSFLQRLFPRLFGTSHHHRQNPLHAIMTDGQMFLGWILFFLSIILGIVIVAVYLEWMSANPKDFESTSS